MITAATYHEILSSAALPISGVSVPNLGAPYVNGWDTPPTPEQETQAAALLEAARPIEFIGPSSFPYDHAATVTINAPADVQSVTVMVRGQAVNVPLANGSGTLDITANAPTLPPHIVITAQNQAVYGYNTITLIAE